ncbi:unnamed protein product [Rotaria sordida]|uniref:C2H2-type domain-containing protein n=1 Tax=Rotaria sordida TaxID=392033 RepID=A0A820FJK9_9BILA|nr:unnamed protein product [Rotaria sordida]
MEYCGGIKNVRTGVAEIIDEKYKLGNPPTIPDVEAVRSIVYNEEGMTIRKASDIGIGKFIKYSNLNITPNMILVEQFSPLSRSNNNQQNKRTGRQMTNFYFCPSDNCMSTFDNELDLNDHIALGKHWTIDDKMNGYDIGKVQLFDKLRETNLPSSNTVTTASSSLYMPTTLPKTMKYFNEPGWALRTRKPPRRIDQAVKNFIKNIIEEEKKYSKRYQPEEYIKRIRTQRNEDGSKTFHPNQYLTLSQVRTFLLFQFAGDCVELEDDKLSIAG